MKWRTLKDWVFLPLALLRASRIPNDEAIKHAVFVSQAIRKQNKNTPYKIAIQFLRKKHKKAVLNQQ